MGDNWFGNAGILGGAGAILGGLGTAYGAIAQDKAARKMFDLQKDSYYTEKARRDRNQVALDNMFQTQLPLVPNAATPQTPKLNLAV